MAANRGELLFAGQEGGDDVRVKVLAGAFHDQLFRAVVLERRLIGTVNFEIDPANRIAMLGYAIARAHWGSGIAVEAATAAIAWAFAEHDLAEIWASTDVEHVRSRRVMEKLGMTFDRGDERNVVYRLRP